MRRLLKLTLEFGRLNLVSCRLRDTRCVLGLFTKVVSLIILFVIFHNGDLSGGVSILVSNMVSMKRHPFDHILSVRYF